MKLYVLRLSDFCGRLEVSLARVFGDGLTEKIRGACGGTDGGSGGGCFATSRGEEAADFTAELLDGSAEVLDALKAGRLAGERCIFAVGLDDSGVSMELMTFIKEATRLAAQGGKPLMAGALCGMVVDGTGELYTKDAARRLAFCVNSLGCALPGKPLVEATGQLYNMRTMAKVNGTDVEWAYISQISNLARKLVDFHVESLCAPKKVAVIHASNRKTSNTLQLWGMVAEGLCGKVEIEEISILNGEIHDCRGCKYETCLHFGENAGCFYGGVITEKVYPAIAECDTVVLICPNYNDAISANIMAFVNRLTALFRTTDFSKKRVFALVVSGYSGGDIVAQQIIGAMNMNKSFFLPGNFVLTETANEPGSILESAGVAERAAKLAERILACGAEVSEG